MNTREIKFRGLTKIGWTYGDLVKCRFSDGYGIGIKDTTYHVNDGKVNLIPEKIIEGTEGQYTGLKDRNGVEIYKGDVVRITVNKHWWVFVIEPSKMAPNGQLYAIERFNNCSIDEDNNTYTYEVTRENSGRRKELLFGNDFEVIGNIYENPELLENTDE